MCSANIFLVLHKISQKTLIIILLKSSCSDFTNQSITFSKREENGVISYNLWFFWGGVYQLLLCFLKYPSSPCKKLLSETSSICTLCNLLSHYYNFEIKIRKWSSVIFGQHQKYQSSSLICKYSNFPGLECLSFRRLHLAAKSLWQISGQQRYWEVDTLWILCLSWQVAQ